LARPLFVIIKVPRAFLRMAFGPTERSPPTGAEQALTLIGTWNTWSFFQHN